MDCRFLQLQIKTSKVQIKYPKLQLKSSNVQIKMLKLQIRSSNLYAMFKISLKSRESSIKSFQLEQK